MKTLIIALVGYWTIYFILVMGSHIERSRIVDSWCAETHNGTLQGDYCIAGEQVIPLPDWAHPRFTW